MLNRTGVTVLGILAVVGVAVAIYATRGGTGGTGPESGSSSATSASAKTGALVFPDLVSRTADVAEIAVKRAPLEFHIKREGDTWRVPEKAGYPAKIETVRSVIVGLSQLIREEEKTSRPEQYSKLGVEDPVAPPPDSADKSVPQSALITLEDDKGKAIASAVLGNPKYAGAGIGGTSNQQMFIRAAGEKAAWLVSGNVDVPREPIGWMDTKFVDIKRPRIKSFVITHPDGSVVAVSRDKQADTFSVRDIPPGKELKDVGVGETLAATMSDLSFQDVAAASSVEQPKTPAPGAAPAPEIKPGPTIVLRTFDGLIVTAKSVSKEAKAWWTMNASVDQSLAVPPPPPEPAPAPKDAKEPEPSKPAPTLAAGGEAKPSADTTPVASTSPPKPATTANTGAPAVGTLDALKKEAAELNAAWAPYAFAPVDWKVRSINSTLNDLLKDSAPPAGAATNPPPPIEAQPHTPPTPAPHP
jgi:hypothetical protein